MKKIFSPIFSLLSGLQILFSMILLFGIATCYIYLITKNLTISVFCGIVSTLLGFYNLVYIPIRLKREQFLLGELQKYATNMTFYMQSGYNVINSLQASTKNVDKEIKKDIEVTVNKLQKEAKLDTSHFKKYHFPAIDIFHQILQIKYEAGGNAKSLFAKANKNINFELAKRDELYRRKRFLKNKVIMMMGMALSIPLLLAFSADDLYQQFLSLGVVANTINLLLFFGVLISLNFLQKASADLNILH